MVAGLMAASLLTTNTSCADYLDKEPDNPMRKAKRGSITASEGKEETVR